MLFVPKIMNRFFCHSNVRYENKSIKKSNTRLFLSPLLFLNSSREIFRHPPFSLSFSFHLNRTSSSLFLLFVQPLASLLRSFLLAIRRFRFKYGRVVWNLFIRLQRASPAQLSGSIAARKRSVLFSGQRGCLRSAYLKESLFPTVLPAFERTAKFTFPFPFRIEKYNQRSDRTICFHKMIITNNRENFCFFDNPDFYRSIDNLFNSSLFV